MDNFFYYDEKVSYPKEAPYMPDQQYPEYPYGDIQDIKSNAGSNKVYDNVRNMLIELEYDKDNIGTKDWNPLGKYIYPGQTVLLKPNLVKHINAAESDLTRGMDCMVTHPSIVRCIFDYVYVALHGEGKIIIADAPVQGCDFEQLQENTGYGDTFCYLKKKQTDQLKVVISDLREVVYHEKGGIGIQEEVENMEWGSHVINLGKDSFFAGIDNNPKVRITCYDGKETEKHHSGEINEYKISDAVLQADVIISISKPKTHRIAGYTGALKNMIGVNARKEYLPHHQKGNRASGGDEYNDSLKILKQINSNLNDAKNWTMKRGYGRLTKFMGDLCQFTEDKLDKLEPNRKKYGMWYGNDTIWRTILDVNRIVYYADKYGEMQELPQRTILHIGDMIVSGDHEGPLNPQYKKVGGLLFSDNPLLFDLFVVKVMGFDWKKFPVLYNAVHNYKIKIDSSELEERTMKSNDIRYNKKIVDINAADIFHFIPTSGWQDFLNER